MSGGCGLQPELFDSIHDFAVAGANNELTEGRWSDFERLLQENDEAYRLYIQYMVQSDLLRAVMDAMPDEDIPAPDAICVEPQEAAAPTYPVFFRSTLTYFSDGMPLAYLLATVITALGLLVMGLVHVSGTDEVAERSATPAIGPATNYVGRITGAVDCRWREGSRVSLGQKCELPSGLLEITYNTGAKVILQGPVNYLVESNGGFLSIGKLTGKLEKKDKVSVHPSSFILHPFSIRTPTATVTDLGTEFGVDVRRDGATETHVFVGAVRVATSDHSRGEQNEQTVHAGSAVRCDRTGKHPSKTTCNQQGFVHALQPRPPQDDRYAGLVLSMNPAAYYRMEDATLIKKDTQVGRYMIADSAPGGHHGELLLNEAIGRKPIANGRFGAALRFGGPMVSDDYVRVPNYPPTTTQQLSFSAWVYCGSRYSYDTIACQHNAAANINGWDGFDNWQFHVGLFLEDGDLFVSINQRNKNHIELREGASHPLPLGKWQHVAFVADGSVLHLYRNGREVASAPCDGVYSAPAIQHMMIGCKDVRESWAARNLQPGFSWLGRIDELATFNRALSADEIRQLFEGRSAKPAPAAKLE
jgi:hypothetical protein